MDQETQIIVVAGVLGGVCLILLICVASLCYQVNKLKAYNRKYGQNGKDNYAYNYPNIQPDEELNKRGYSMHEGPKMPRLQNIGGGLYGVPPRESSQSRSNNSRDPPRDYMNNDRLSDDFLPSDFTKVDDFNKGKKPQLRSQSQIHQHPQQSQPRPSAFELNNRYAPNPPRTSQFNNNILYGQGANQSQGPEDKTYFNNRAITQAY